jgi:hypothetical protein
MRDKTCTQQQKWTSGFKKEVACWLAVLCKSCLSAVYALPAINSALCSFH